MGRDPDFINIFVPGGVFKLMEYRINENTVKWHDCKHILRGLP